MEFLNWPFIVSNSDFWLSILLSVPIYLALVWGGCWNILPEIIRLKDGARYNPSVAKIDNLMLVSIWTAIGFSVGLSSIYSIAWNILRIELAYPAILSWTRRGIITGSIFVVGLVAVISRRMDYSAYESPKRPWSFSRISKISGFGSFYAGLFVTPLFPLAGLGLIIAGPVLLLVGTSVRRNSIRSIVPATPARYQNPGELRARSDEIGQEERVAVAKQISDMIVRKYGKRIMAVCLWGSGADDRNWPYPEFDLLAVVRGGERIPPKQYFFKGLSIRISYREESGLLRSASEVDEDWARGSSWLRTRSVLFERDEWFQNLEKALKESDKTAATGVIRELAWTLASDLAFLRVDKQRGDAIETRSGGNHVASDCVNLIYLLNRRYFTNSFWKDVFDCPEQPPDFRNLVETAAGLIPASNEDVTRAAEKLGEEVLEMVRVRGISVESSELLV